MNRINLLTIVLLFLTIGMAQGQQDKKVAVFDPVGDVSNNLKSIIREELSNAVVNTLGFTVLERELINKVLAENEFQMTGHVDDGQIGELGKKMGANYVCYASISSVGGNYYISCKLVDVITANIERQNTGITQSGLDDLFSVVSSVSRAMLQQQETSVKGGSTVKKRVTPRQNIENSSELTKLNCAGMSLLVMPTDVMLTRITWMEANAACLQSTAYGLEDWRLPTKSEIAQMFKQKSQLKNMQGYWYWSGTPENEKEYYRQAFDADKLVPAAAFAKAFVRCVHDNGRINFEDENGVWAFSFNGQDYLVMPDDIQGKYKWKDARNACESSNAHGYSDWYLPSIDELDYLYNNRIALNMHQVAYWSSTPKKPGTKNPMLEKHFFEGKTLVTMSPGRRAVRCIRKK